MSVDFCLDLHNWVSDIAYMRNVQTKLKNFPKEMRRVGDATEVPEKVRET